MKTDGLFSFKVVHIPVKYNKPIRIVPIGDVHYNNPAFARDIWDRDKKRWSEYCRHKDTYFITTGDIFEAMSTTERHHYIQTGLHDSNKTRWEREYAREVKTFCKEVPFMIDRTIACAGGNHFFSFYDGTTSDMALASELHAPYLGCSGYIILILEIGGYSHVVKIFVNHGKSSGRKAGSSFNALEDAASYFVDADIVLMGHDHKSGAVTLPALKCDQGHGNWKIKAFDRIVARTGSYLKSYEPETRSYAHDALYRPSTLGGVELIITVNRVQRMKRPDDRWVSIKAVV